MICFFRMWIIEDHVGWSDSMISTFPDIQDFRVHGDVGTDNLHPFAMYCREGSLLINIETGEKHVQQFLGRFLFHGTWNVPSSTA